MCGECGCVGVKRITGEIHGRIGETEGRLRGWEEEEGGEEEGERRREEEKENGRSREMQLKHHIHFPDLCPAMEVVFQSVQETPPSSSTRYASSPAAGSPVVPYTSC